MEKFYKEIQKVFNSLEIYDIPKFQYNSEIMEYYSLTSVNINDKMYSIVVPEDGSVQYGIIEEDEFYPEGILGYVFL